MAVPLQEIRKHRTHPRLVLSADGVQLLPPGEFNHRCLEKATARAVLIRPVFQKLENGHDPVPQTSRHLKPFLKTPFEPLRPLLQNLDRQTVPPIEITVEGPSGDARFCENLIDQRIQETVS